MRGQNITVDSPSGGFYMIPSHTLHRRVLYALAAVTLAGLGAGTAPAQSYAVTDLGTLTGGFTSAGYGLNNFGHAVGVSSIATADYHGFFYTGSLTEVPPLVTSTQSHAFAINESNQVVAMSYDLGELETHGLRWQAGVTTNLSSVAARGTNSAGDVVGYFSTMLTDFGWVDHAALWQNGSIYDLGTLGGHFSFAYARRATLWRAGAVLDLGTLGGSSSQAYNLNQVGQVVGVADTAAGAPHAFLFQLDAAGNVVTRTDLGVLGGGNSYAYAVNSSGQVVGTSNARAFTWQAGTMQDLNALIPPAADWRLDTAWAVNDHGQIVGTGLHHGQPRAFLLTPGVLGDLNCDGVLNNFDITPFVQALTDPAGYAAAHPDCNIMLADINGDGFVNNFDITPFVHLLTGP
jgi:probable HAF family extracellular repeat protein